MEETKEGEYCKYTFKYIDALCQDENDINGMLSTTYKIKMNMYQKWHWFCWGIKS